MRRIPLSIALVICALTIAATASAQVQSEPRYAWSVTGPVFDTARVDNTIYAVGAAGIGVAPATNAFGRFVVLSTSHGLAAQDTPDVAGNSVAALADDGAGGWYLGGAIQQVGNAPRSGLAHILATGNVDATFAPAFNGAVLGLRRQGTTLYAVGNFTTVNGQARGGGAALNLAAAGALLAWNPALDAAVGTRGATALVVSGSTVYLGGTFTTASATARVGFAAVDATSGALLPAPVANLNAGGSLNALALSGTTLYVGGTFTTIASTTRANLAAIDTALGAALPFSADTNNTVRSLLLDGADLYIGGPFGQVSGQLRSGLARVDAISGALATWHADVLGAVISMLRVGTTLYIGGNFFNVAGQPRAGIAALAIATGAPLPWNPGGAGGAVLAMALTPSGDLAVGGGFTHVTAAPRSGLVAIDIVTNELLPLSILANGQIRSVTATGDTLYLSGTFTTVNNQSRNGFAAVNRFSGALLPWNPNAGGSIGTNSGGRGVALLGSTALIGGSFTTIGGLPHVGLAQVDALTGAPTAFVSDAVGGGVTGLVRAGTTVYVTGDFTTIGGQPRPCLAAFDVSAATPVLSALALTSVGGTAPVIVSAKVAGSTLYLVGGFTGVNGQSRVSTAAIALPGGALTAFAPAVDGAVFDIDIAGGTAYLAGGFANVNGVPRRSFAAVDTATGKATQPFAPSFSVGNGQTVTVSSEGLLAGGNNLDGSENLQFFPASGMGGLPGAPAPPSTFALSNFLVITWGPPSVGGAPIDYRLEVGSGPGLTNIATIPIGSTDPFFFYQGAPPGLYYVRVRAVSAAGIGPASPEVAFVPNPPACGGGPRQVTPSASVSGGNVLLTWPDPVSSNGGLSYTLSAGTGPGLANIGTFPLGAAMQFGAVAPPGAYFVRVGAQGPCGVTAPSPDLLVSVGGVLPLPAPVATASVVGGVASMSWTAVPGATSYRLDAGSGPLLANIAQLPIGGTSFATPAPPGTYYVRIHAIGPAGTSRGSNELVVIVP